MMRVYGVKVSRQALEAALSVMRGSFTMTEVREAIAAQLGPVQGKHGESSRKIATGAATRLLQRERQAGRISWNGNVWTGLEQTIAAQADELQQLRQDIAALDEFLSAEFPKRSHALIERPTVLAARLLREAKARGAFAERREGQA